MLRRPPPLLSLRAFLLLLALLPGLLLPSGFGVARCDCTQSLRVVPRGATTPCHANASRVNDASCGKVRSCCHAGDATAGAKNARAPSDPATTNGAGAADCRCEANLIPPQPPRHSPADQSFEQPLALFGSLPWQAPAPPPYVAHIWIEHARGPPCPDRKRNLPLLL